MTMKPPCATFSDSRHAVQTTKISLPTKSNTENWTTKSWQFIWITYIEITMKPPCATFSDSRHAVQTQTKISFKTQSTTENWTTKSLLFRWIIVKASTI